MYSYRERHKQREMEGKRGEKQGEKDSYCMTHHYHYFDLSNISTFLRLINRGANLILSMKCCVNSAKEKLGVIIFFTTHSRSSIHLFVEIRILRNILGTILKNLLRNILRNILKDIPWSILRDYLGTKLGNILGNILRNILRNNLRNW